MTGCGKPASEIKINKDCSVPGTFQTYDAIDVSEIQKKIINTKFRFKTDCAQEYYDSFSEFPDYSMLSACPVKEAYDRTKKIQYPVIRKELQLMDKLPLDKSEFTELLLKNSHDNHKTGAVKASDDDIKWTAEQLCDALNQEFQRRGTEWLGDRIYAVDSMLSSMVIEQGTGLNLAATGDDGHIKIARALIDNDLTVTHEFEHILQLNPPELREKMGVERSFGFMHEFDDFDINPMIWYWYIESSAERIAAELKNELPQTYSTYIKYLDFFSAVSAAGGNDPADFPKLTQTSDAEEFFRTLGADTEEEKLDIISAFTAVEFICSAPKTGMDKFYEQHFGKEADKVTEEEIKLLNNNMKCQAAQTAGRLFWKNIIKNASSSELSAGDIFFLTASFEKILYNIAPLTSEYMKPFLETFTSQQDFFFDKLSEETDISSDEIREAYKAFTGKADIPEISSHFLPAEAKIEKWTPYRIDTLKNSDRITQWYVYYTYRRYKSSYEYLEDLK